MTHLFPLSRPMVAVCIWPVVQHNVILLKYFSTVAYFAVELCLEVVFEWEVIGEAAPPSNLPTARRRLRCDERDGRPHARAL